jgi:hypothetical protein
MNAGSKPQAGELLHIAIWAFAECAPIAGIGYLPTTA